MIRKFIEWVLDELYGPVCYEFKVKNCGAIIFGTLVDLADCVRNEEEDFLLEEEWSVRAIRMKWEERKQLPEHDGW